MVNVPYTAVLLTSVLFSQFRSHILKKMEPEVFQLKTLFFCEDSAEACQLNYAGGQTPKSIHIYLPLPPPGPPGPPSTDPVAALPVQPRHCAPIASATSAPAVRLAASRTTTTTNPTYVSHSSDSSSTYSGSDNMQSSSSSTCAIATSSLPPILGEPEQCDHHDHHQAEVDLSGLVPII